MATQLAIRLSDRTLQTLDRLIRAAGQDLDLIAAEGAGIDRTQFRTTLRLSPSGRLARAAQGARALRQLRSARTVN